MARYNAVQALGSDQTIFAKRRLAGLLPQAAFLLCLILLCLVSLCLILLCLVWLHSFLPGVSAPQSTADTSDRPMQNKCFPDSRRPDICFCFVFDVSWPFVMFHHFMIARCCVSC